MLERLNPILRIACLVFVGLLIYQCSRVLLRKDPVGDLNLGALLDASPSSKAPNTNAAMATKPSGSNAPPPRVAQPNIANLPSNVQARIDRVVESEILGTIVRPMPMALLGIAGNHAFLRTPNGQTGLLKEGDELGGIKVLKIGANRVLVEEENQKKELMIFSGFGSETLIPKGEPH